MTHVSDHTPSPVTGVPLPSSPSATKGNKNHYQEPPNVDKANEYEECLIVSSESSLSYDDKFQEKASPWTTRDSLGIGV